MLKFGYSPRIPSAFAMQLTDSAMPCGLLLLTMLPSVLNYLVLRPRILELCMPTSCQCTAVKQAVVKDCAKSGGWRSSLTSRRGNHPSSTRLCITSRRRSTNRQCRCLTNQYMHSYTQIDEAYSMVFEIPEKETLGTALIEYRCRNAWRVRGLLFRPRCVCQAEVCLCFS